MIDISCGVNSHCHRLLLGIAFTLSLLSLIGCGSSATAPPSSADIPTPTQAIAPTATPKPMIARPAPTLTPVPTDTPTPVPTDTPRPEPATLKLTIVHTNDTWGYLEPCG